MKIIFMGTPDIAAQSLNEIIKSNKHEVCAVFTREDKPVGRKQILTAPPVKQLAIEHGITVYQPKTLRNEESLQLIKSLNPDIIVVVAYGRILPKEILNVPKFGAINLHVSLLPKYRGSAPIQWAVINGDSETGVTIMQLDEGVDTGDIIDSLPIQIDANETSGELFEKVSSCGAAFLCKVMDDIANNTIAKTKQNHDMASEAPMLSKEMALFNFEKTAYEIHNLIRGLNPWPVAYFMHEDKKIKVKKSTYIKNENGKAGEIIFVKPLTVACGDGAIVLNEVVPEGSRPMEGSAWAVGKRLQAGDII